MSDQHYRICNRCIMDTSDTEIQFDEKGFCNHCNSYFTKEPFYVFKGTDGERKLKELVHQIKFDGKKREYDCAVGISGGVDSSYVAYLTKKLGLRALTVHMDNGWNSEMAVKNVENIVKRLNFDYQSYVINWEEFKDIQLSFLKASVSNVEIPTDHAFLAALYWICSKNNIKYILSGSNYVTEAILPKSWGYNAKDLYHLESIHKKFGTIKLKTYPKLGFKKELFYTYIKGIKMIRLLNYVPYVKENAMKILQDELGWKYYGGKHYESVFTRFFQAYILPKKFKIDKRRAHLSTLICSDQITRKEAMEAIKEELYPANKLNEDRDYVIKKLNLSKEEFQSIIDNPVKSYKDYPSDETTLGLLYKAYYFLKGK